MPCSRGAGSRVSGNSSNCVGSAISYTWQQALQQGDSNNLAGYSDWRLPNVNELHSLVAYDRHNPTINTTVFPNTLSQLYWSSSPHKIRNAAWYVNFFVGRDEYYSREYRVPRVRLVRDGQ